MHAKDGIRLVQFASGAYCLEEDATVEGHAEPQPTGTVVVKCTFWDRVIGKEWDGCFQPPRNYCEENKIMFRLDDVLASGLALMLVTPLGEEGNNPPPASLLYQYNRTQERKLRCRFLDKEDWLKLLSEKQVRSSMEEVAVEFFETYKQEDDTTPQPQIDATE